MNDKKPFYFTPSDSKCAEKIFKEYKINFTNNTIYYLYNNQFYTKSKAIRYILNDLRRIWFVFSFFISILPNSFTDLVYDFIAKYRYKLFGKKYKCLLSKKQESLLIQVC